VKRWTKNLCCLFSLLVFVGSVALWVRSYFVCETIITSTVHTDSHRNPVWSGFVDYIVTWARGTIGFDRWRVEYEGSPGVGGQWNYRRSEPIKTAIMVSSPEDKLNLHAGGFQLLYSVRTDELTATYEHRLVLPLWLFLPLGIPPLLWWRRWKRNRGRGFAVLPAPPPSAPASPAAKI
jgi:hypothetical protein